MVYRLKRITTPSLPRSACYIAVLILTLVATLGCGALSKGPGMQKHGARAVAVPDFAGTATPVSPPSSCPRVLPDNVLNPFTSAGRVTAVTDHQLVGCWVGSLDGKSFILSEFFSQQAGGGLAVEYGGAVVARFISGSGAPTIVRFTGNYVCDAEKAGAYFQAVNLQTGARIDDEEAQKVCPPPEWPPKYVMGLGSHRYPIIWPAMRR
jgi:hypothetical protein